MSLRPLLWISAIGLASTIGLGLLANDAAKRGIKENGKAIIAADESGYWRAENQLHSILDSDFNRKIVEDQLADGDRFTRLSAMIDNAEPPIIRPVIWDNIATVLRLSGKTTLEAIGEVLDRFKLPALK